MAAAENNTKRCSRCKKVLSREAFSRCKKTKFGLQSKCKKCHRAVQQQLENAYISGEKPYVLVEEKWCSGCQQVLSVTQFQKSHSRSTGVAGTCRTCARQAVVRSEVLYANGTKSYALVEEKWCPACQRILKAKDFYKEKRRKDNLSAHCKSCKNQQHNIYGKALNKNRRARKKSASVVDLTDAQWEFLKAFHKYRCYYCGKKTQHLTQDHIVPLGTKGSHTMSNIVPACRSCNSKKGTKPPPIPVQPLLALGIHKSQCLIIL